MNSKHTLRRLQSGTKIPNNCYLLMFILTVEDEFLIGEYLRAILESSGHRVIATFDADEAIEVLERVRKHPACHYRHQHARLNGWAPVGGCHQRQMAADPLDRRDRVGAAKQERIAQ
jgi:hypothetical protein